MKLTLTRLTTVSGISLMLLLAGCASHPAHPGPAEAGRSQPAAEGSAAPHSQPSGTKGTSHGSHAAAAGTPVTEGKLPDSTGIPACDDYLSSYVACHRAAAVYKPDEIQGRYEAMRTSLLRDAQDPSIRPNLATRCNSLASQLRQALHGKSCEGAPAVPSSGN
jgi:hypothetical protein